jgi:predicted kinase
MTAREPILLIIAGPPCSGKSTLAAALATALGFEWLQTDVILSALIPGSDRRKSDRDIAYRATLLLAGHLLRCSRPVLLDATYGSTEHRQAVEACAAAAGVSLHLVQCRISPQTAVARFKERGDHPATDLDEDRVRDLAERYRYFEPALILSAETPAAEAIRRVTDHLERGAPVPSDGSWSKQAVGYWS